MYYVKVYFSDSYIIFGRFSYLLQYIFYIINVNLISIVYNVEKANHYSLLLIIPIINITIQTPNNITNQLPIRLNIIATNPISNITGKNTNPKGIKTIANGIDGL